MEQNEIDLLRGEGFPIETVFFGRPKIYKTKKMTLSRLVDLADVYVKMQVNEDELFGENAQNVITEQIIAVKTNAKRAAQVLAIACSDGWLKRKFLTWLFMRTINPAELKNYTQKLFKQSDYQNFTLSIVLMNGNKITKPQTIEKQTA